MTFSPQVLSRRPVIGVLSSWPVYSGTLNTLLGPILRGICDSARAQACNVLLACGVVPDSSVFTVAWPFYSENVDFLPVGPWNTDGLIVIAPNKSDPEQAQFIADMLAAEHPMVFVETAEFGPAVCLDNESGIKSALLHLRAHGHTRIAFIGGDSQRQGDSQERLRAYLAGCQEAGLEIDARLMEDGFLTAPGGYAAMQRILSRDSAFTAVLACNDESAIGAMQALREAGKNIPQDVAVVGFDNRFEARSQTPALTTVNQPAYEIGWQSLALMLRRLEGSAGPETIERVATQLVIRESCGCSTGSANQSVGQHDSLNEAITMAVLAQTGQMHLDNIRKLSARLVDGFMRSLSQGEPAAFQSALQAVLAHIEPWGEDAHAWQLAIQLLRQHALSQNLGLHPALDWLDQARMEISQFAQHHLLRYFAYQNWFTEQVSLMSAELSETIDLESIQPILNRYAPRLGIKHARLVLFEPDAQDPFAWSLIPGHTQPPLRFPTRSFPTAGLYADSEVYQLALLPIRLRKKTAGFAAFDASNLGPCLDVVRQLTSTLENIRLYGEAAEGRRLAEEADRLKSRFLSTISHELRTPLNLIVGWSEMMFTEPGISAPQIARQIYASAQHLGRLIRDVLDLASSDAGQLRLTCEPLDLSEALQMVCEIGQQLCAEKGLDWRVNIPPRLPLVWADRTRLQQVCLNLISNAVKFTTTGAVMLQIRVLAEEVEVSIKDTGLGIPPEEQPWIFDEFRQSERTTSRGYGGLGLGLAICKRLIELHNGTIGVESKGEEGAGSTFYFRLPVLNDSPSHSEAQKQKVLILTTQDEPVQIIQSRLERAGFLVEWQSVAQDKDWLSKLLVSPPGAIVLDESLAAEHGWELLKILKGNPRTANILLLFYALDSDAQTGSVLSFDYLMKPVGEGELLQALARQGLTSEGDDEEKTILIVDDDPGMLEINARILTRHFPAYHILKACNGRVALDILDKTPINLVLLDLMMPEVDGFGVLAQMHARETTRNTPVIVLTSKTLTESDMERLQQGVVMVMHKGLYAAPEMLGYIESKLAHNPHLGSDSQRLARRAMAYIHENYALSLSRQDIARYVNASDGHLARCFKQETGLTPMVYLNRYRIQRAKYLLENTSQSITSIAISCGFSDVNYFSRVFRQETGKSPRTYRRSAHGKTSTK